MRAVLIVIWRSGECEWRRLDVLLQVLLGREGERLAVDGRGVAQVDYWRGGSWRGPWRQPELGYRVDDLGLAAAALVLSGVALAFLGSANGIAKGDAAAPVDMGAEAGIGDEAVIAIASVLAMSGGVGGVALHTLAVALFGFECGRLCVGAALFFGEKGARWSGRVLIETMLLAAKR